MTPPSASLETALAVGDGAGEAALPVPEELGHRQVALLELRAVDRHERLPAARPKRCSGLGERLLAHAALAEDQHRLFVARDLLELAQQVEHARSLADDLDGAIGTPQPEGPLAQPQRGLAEEVGGRGFAVPERLLVGGPFGQARRRHDSDTPPLTAIRRNSPPWRTLLDKKTRPIYRPAATRSIHAIWVRTGPLYCHAARL